MAARARNIVAGNETYIGRRVISSNMQRELPTFIQYLSGSYRHVVAKSTDPDFQTNWLADIETHFTAAFRTGNWLEPHLQVVNSDLLHGRGVFMVIPSSTSALDTVPVYVPPEDFIFPTEARDLQSAPMLAVRYVISVHQFKEWADRYKWNPGVVAQVASAFSAPDHYNTPVPVYIIFYKAGGVVQRFWYTDSQKQALTAVQPLDAGLRGPDGTALPTNTYPFFPAYYNITENPRLIERKGRAHADMHDQEALTMMWTGYVNGMMRASEIYIAFRDSGMTENPEVGQTEFIMDPGKILKRPVDFFSAPWPDSSMLQACQALSTENANMAGQVDFAAQSRKDSRKTAKELTLAEEQSSRSSTIPITMFAVGYGVMLEFMWEVLSNNIRTGYNQTFMVDYPEVRDLIASGKISIRPSGDIDYIERQEKLKKYTNYYQLYANTAVGMFFLRKILELAFPDEFPQMEPLLQDNSKQMGAALFGVLRQLPLDQMQQAGIIAPETAAQLQQIIAEASQTYATDQKQPAAPGAGPS